MWYTRARRAFLRWGLPISTGASILVHALVRDFADPTVGPGHFLILYSTGVLVAAGMSAVYAYVEARLP